MRRYFYPLLFLLLQGCSVTSNKDFFDAHEKSFKASNTYQTHFIQRGVNKIHVREFGKRTREPTLILMHGFPDNMHLYDRLLPELPKHRHVITFDFLGWGDSDKPKQHHYNFLSLRQDLDSVIKYFNLDNVILVAHDASGIPSIEWSLENPNEIAGLVLLNTFYHPMPTLKTPEAIAVFSTPGLKRSVSIWATSLSDTLWMKYYKEQIAKFISTEELREPFQKILTHKSLAMRNAFYGLNNVLQQSVQERANNVSKLQAFKPPVLIAFGNDDPYLNSGVAKEFHKIFPNSKLVLIKKAGHFVQVDAPKQVAQLIKSFR